MSCLRNALAACSLLCLFSFAFAGDETASNEPSKTPQSKPSSGPFTDGKLLGQTSPGTIASRVLNHSISREVKEQIRFDVQFLRVDGATREKIYRLADPDSLKTAIAPVVDSTSANADDGLEPELTSHHRTTTASVVSTGILDEENLAAVMKHVSESETSAVTVRPTIIAIDGQVAGIQQRVQRPFLSQVKEVVAGDENGIESEIQVLNEGTDLCVQGDLKEGDLKSGAIHVRAKLQHSRVTDVKEHKVYGIGESVKTIQVPSHEVKMVTASQLVTQGQTLILDPHFQSVIQPDENETGIPVPYADRVFKAKQPEPVVANLVILITPRQLQRSVNR